MCIRILRRRQSGWAEVAAGDLAENGATTRADFAPRKLIIFLLAICCGIVYNNRDGFPNVFNPRYDLPNLVSSDWFPDLVSGQQG